MALTGIRARFALAALAEVKAAAAAYESELDDWYRAGDGRPARWVTEHDDDGNPRTVNRGGMGYAFPYCPHGMSLWTDYDNICGYCEDSRTPYEIALGIAAQREAEYDNGMALLKAVHAFPLSYDTRLAVANEVSERMASLWHKSPSPLPLP